MEMTLGHREHFSGAITRPKPSVPSARAHIPFYAYFQTRFINVTENQEQCHEIGR